MTRPPRRRPRPVVITSTADAGRWQVDVTKTHSSGAGTTATQTVGVTEDPLEAAEVMLDVLRARTHGRRT